MTRDDLLRSAASVLSSAEEIDLACHVGPDGDAIGSMLGLGIAARNAGKVVRASYGSPYAGGSGYEFLPTGLLVPPSEIPARPDVLVVLDVGAPDRLGELAENAANAKTVIVLDHHVTNDGFGDIAVVDARAAATGELVFDLLDLLGWAITPDVANCLHTALMTDTGRFTYTNTTDRSMEIAAELLRAGATPQEISRHVYEEAPFGYLKAAALALGRAELHADAAVVATHISQDDLNRCGVDWGDIDNLIDTLRLAEEADVALLAKVHSDGRVKVSMRSRGATDVGSLAAASGGGGHRLAAGFTVEKGVEQVIDDVLGVVEDYR